MRAGSDLNASALGSERARARCAHGVACNGRACTYNDTRTRAHGARHDRTGDSMADTIERATWDACARQADMARLLGREGKAFRDVTRRVFGAYVSHGDTLDVRLRDALYAYHVTHANDADARIALVKAYKAGEDIPA
jgi:hypothetical protein